MNKSILLVCLALAACGGGSDSNDFADAQRLATHNTSINAAGYAHGQAFTVQGDAAVTESCLQGSGAGVATLADGAMIACPTYMAGQCVSIATAPTATCNSHLRYPFPQL